MEIPYTTEVRPDTGLTNPKLGIWLFLASEVMLFGSLFSSYALLAKRCADVAGAARDPERAPGRPQHCGPDSPRR
jgi:heme/copper-type cytochrome/quinol oxidase subunit 3